MRVKIRNKAQVFEGREMLGLSQQGLADKLGWKRARIKRLESGELVSLPEEDLRALERVLQRGTANVISLERARRRASNVISIKPPDLDAAALFSSAKRIREKPQGSHAPSENRAYFRAKMKVAVGTADLLGKTIDVNGVRGCVHGVMRKAAQDPLRPGDVVTILVWAKGINA